MRRPVGWARPHRPSAALLVVILFPVCVTAWWILIAQIERQQLFARVVLHSEDRTQNIAMIVESRHTAFRDGFGVQFYSGSSENGVIFANEVKEPSEQAVSAGMRAVRDQSWTNKDHITQLIQAGGGERMPLVWWRVVLSGVVIVSSILLPVNAMLIIAWQQIRSKCKKNLGRLHAGLCPYCQYEREPALARCPECGLRFAPYEQRALAKLARPWFWVGNPDSDSTSFCSLPPS